MYDALMTKKILLLNRNIVVISFTFLIFSSAIAIAFPSTVSQVLALTRGTPYNDVLTSEMVNNSGREDQIGEAAGTGAGGIESVFIYGDYGNDEIQGSTVSDHLSGGPGSDVIYGMDGGDFIEGGTGVDSLYGLAGDDVLIGGEAADYFDCGSGNDSVDDFDPSEGDFALDNCEVLQNEGRPVR
jgi:Ca2+-binding RTX toxin-like protein